MTKIMNRNLVLVYSETSIILDFNFCNELIKVKLLRISLLQKLKSRIIDVSEYTKS